LKITSTHIVEPINLTWSTWPQVTVAAVSVGTVAVGGTVVGEGVVARVAANGAAKNAADLVTNVRAITKFFAMTRQSLQMLPFILPLFRRRQPMPLAM
jgi:hypothetical protein